MKQYVVVFLAGLLMLPFIANAQSGSIGFLAGLSSPNDEIANVYNSNTAKFTDLNSVGRFISEGAKSGWHAGVKLRLPLISNVAFTAGAAYHHFPETKTVAIDETTGGKVAELLSTQDLIPITAGLNLYFLNKEFASAYLTGELSYNYNKNDVKVNLTSANVQLDMDTEPSYSRVGAGVGAGINFNLLLFNLNLEARYNFMNLIGRDSGEEMKKYLTVSVGVYFGKGVK